MEFDWLRGLEVRRLEHVQVEELRLVRLVEARQALPPVPQLVLVAEWLVHPKPQHWLLVALGLHRQQLSAQVPAQVWEQMLL